MDNTKIHKIACSSNTPQKLSFCAEDLPNDSSAELDQEDKYIQKLPQGQKSSTLTDSTINMKK